MNASGVAQAMSEQTFPRYILFMEEDSNYCYLLFCLLKRAGFEGTFLSFSDTERMSMYIESLDIISNVSIALIISVKSTEPNELAILRHFRYSPASSSKPVIVLTTDPTSELLDTCFQLGCIACFSKTADLQELIMALEELSQTLPGRGEL